ncbi:hypothetical protein [Bacillus cereus]|nr:hypothetical protein [Bacillus cereus]
MGDLKLDFQVKSLRVLQ